MSERKPIIVVGGGPVGLTTALGLDFYGLPFLLFEDDAELSRDTKAGTILTRTIEADALPADAIRLLHRGFVDTHERIGSGIRQRSQQHGIHGAADRGGAADANR